MEGWPGVVRGPTADLAEEESFLGEPFSNKREQGSVSAAGNASGAAIAPWLIDDDVSYSTAGPSDGVESI